MTKRPYSVDDFEDEPVEVEIAEDAGIVIAVRFSRDEAYELGDEQLRTGVYPTTFIREYTLAAIRAGREADREQLAD